MQTLCSLTQERLKGLLDYNPNDGIFTWKHVIPGKSVGRIAGSKDKDGYIQIQVDGRIYKAHRLAYLFMNGSFPDYLIDHRNTDPSDNKWHNLRNATNSQNLANMKVKSSGVKGIWLCKITNRWRVQIQKDYKRFYLGRFNTQEEACAAYKAAAKQLFGEFARAA